MTVLTTAGLTHVGMKRSHNEDSLFLMDEQQFYVVADGMGGHASGEVASKLAVETLQAFYDETAADLEKTWPYKMDKALSYEENRIITGVKLANKSIFEQAQADLRLKGMGTTVVAIKVNGNEVFVGHVGDSRAYRIRDGAIEQITEDHSLLNDYIKMRNLTPEEIENFPHKNVIVRALGMKDQVQVDTSRQVPEPNDILLLCSDGLSGMITDDEILDVTLEHEDLDEACGALIEAANNNGGNDNVTVVLVRFDEE